MKLQWLCPADGRKKRAYQPPRALAKEGQPDSEQKSVPEDPERAEARSATAVTESASDDVPDSETTVTEKTDPVSGVLANLTGNISDTPMLTCATLQDEPTTRRNLGRRCKQAPTRARVDHDTSQVGCVTVHKQHSIDVSFIPWCFRTRAKRVTLLSPWISNF